jgi:hypothetical protein
MTNDKATRLKNAIRRHGEDEFVPSVQSVPSNAAVYLIMALNFIAVTLAVLGIVLAVGVP